MNADRTRIVDRVRKLLALGENDGATEAEAALAMERAHELLREHNLSLFEVGDLQDAGPVTEGKTLIGASKWKQVLYGAVARVNYCEMLINGRREYLRVIIVGRADNVATAIATADWLAVRLEQMARSATIAAHLPRGEAMRYRTGWLVGATWRLRERMVEIRTAEKKQETSTALVVLFERENDEYLGRMRPDIEEAKNVRLRSTSARGYHAGLKAGDAIPLAPVHELAE